MLLPFVDDVVTQRRQEKISEHHRIAVNKVAVCIVKSELRAVLYISSFLWEDDVKKIV